MPLSSKKCAWAKIADSKNLAELAGVEGEFVLPHVDGMLGGASDDRRGWGQRPKDQAAFADGVQAASEHAGLLTGAHSDAFIFHLPNL